MSVKKIKVPSVGESVTEVTLSQWLVEDGSYVELDQPLCEFESDKATLELPSEAAGKITFKVEEGADLEIGDVVAEIDTDAEEDKDTDTDQDIDKDEDKKEKKEEKKEESEGKKEKEKEEDEGEDEEKEEEKKKEKGKGEDKEGSYAEGHASPAAAKLMREHDLSEEDIDGSGKDGRIIKEDVQNALDDKDEEKKKDEEEKEADEKVEEKKEEKEKKTEKPDFASKEFSRDTSKEKMSRMRRTIARRLVSAKNQTAMLTTFNEVDLTEIMQMRKKYQEKFVEKYDIKLGFMSLFAKACANVLMEMKNVNAQLDDDHLIYHDFVDISIAISTDKGLVVPPVHNVESLSLAEIEWEIKELADKARNGKLSLEEMQGGTFTITNGGIFGSVMSTPILNEPQSAILGMHTIQQRPMAIDGEVKIRPMMYLALSYDHRVIDGSSAVTFLVNVKELLEDPVRMMLDI